MRVTCDANFLVRAALTPNGLAATIVDIALCPPHVLVLSDSVLDHLGRALRYPRIQRRYTFPDSAIHAYLAYLRNVSEMVIGPTIVPVVVADPDDDEIVATAVDGKANVIGTNDHHFDDPAVIIYCAAHGIRILTDVQLVAELRATLP